MKRFKLLGFILLLCSASSSVQADSTLVYKYTAQDGRQTQYKIAISGRWLRMEFSPSREYDYMVMDTGRLLQFEVDDDKKQFQTTRMGRLFWPETRLNAPKFKPLKKKLSVAGKSCVLVSETGTEPGQAYAQHCMSSGGSIGLNAREMTTLSRLFMSLRRMDRGVLGVATSDERQVSIKSSNVPGAILELVSVEHQLVDSSSMKIPVSYKRLSPDLPVK